MIDSHKFFGTCRPVKLVNIYSVLGTNKALLHMVPLLLFMDPRGPSLLPPSLTRVIRAITYEHSATISSLCLFLSNLAHIFICDEHIPGTEISVHEFLAGQVLHAQCDLLRVGQQQLGSVRWDHTKFVEKVELFYSIVSLIMSFYPSLTYLLPI